MSRRVRLALLGDLMLGRGVSRALPVRGPDWFWGDVLPALRAADGAIGNLECPITKAPKPWRRELKFFHFRADPEAVSILRAGNVRAVCLANNHTLDYDIEGLTDTLAALDATGVAYAGAGRDRAQAQAPAAIECGGTKIGMIAATDGMAAFAADEARPGTNVLRFREDAETLDWVERSVTSLRDSGAGPIVLSLHWGFNLSGAPPERFRRFAHAAIERGVDVLHGHSLHVVQAVERHGRGLILYGAGNTLDDYWKFPFRPTISSFVFLLDLADGKPDRLEMLPVQIRGARVTLARGRAFAKVTGRMMRRCAELGTRVMATQHGLEVPREVFDPSLASASMAAP